VPKIIEIRKYLFKLQLKMSGVFLRHTVLPVASVESNTTLNTSYFREISNTKPALYHWMENEKWTKKKKWLLHTTAIKLNEHILTWEL